MAPSSDSRIWCNNVCTKDVHEMTLHNLGHAQTQNLWRWILQLFSTQATLVHQLLMQLGGID